MAPTSKSASPSSGTPAPLARLARVGGGSIVKVRDDANKMSKLQTISQDMGGGRAQGKPTVSGLVFPPLNTFPHHQKSLNS